MQLSSVLFSYLWLAGRRNAFIHHINRSTNHLAAHRVGPGNCSSGHRHGREACKIASVMTLVSGGASTNAMQRVLLCSVLLTRRSCHLPFSFHHCGACSFNLVERGVLKVPSPDRALGVARTMINVDSDSDTSMIRDPRLTQNPNLWPTLGKLPTTNCSLRGCIRKNWNDTEKISMAPAQG
jgi:hypothetical protein